MLRGSGGGKNSIQGRAETFTITCRAHTNTASLKFIPEGLPGLIEICYALRYVFHLPEIKPMKGTKMIPRSANFLFLLACISFLGGCASLNGNVPFQYQPSLNSSEKKIDSSVGLNLLTDARPDKDKQYTKSINDVPEKITAKFLDDFKASGMFTDIHYPARPGDDVVINGTVDRFKWKLYIQGWVYIPYVGLALELVGVPCVKAYGTAAVALQIKDNKTGAVLGELLEETETISEYTLYNQKAGEAGAELAESLRTVAKKLKEGFSTKVDWRR